MWVSEGKKMMPTIPTGKRQLPEHLGVCLSIPPYAHVWVCLFPVKTKVLLDSVLKPASFHRAETYLEHRGPQGQGLPNVDTSPIRAPEGAVLVEDALPCPSQSPRVGPAWWNRVSAPPSLWKDSSEAAGSGYCFCVARCPRAHWLGHRVCPFLV